METGIQFFLVGIAFVLIGYLWSRDLGEQQSVKIQNKINDAETKIEELNDKIKCDDIWLSAGKSSARLSGNTSDSKERRKLKESRDKAINELKAHEARIDYLENKRKTQKPIADLTAIIGLVAAVIGLIKEIWLK